MSTSPTVSVIMNCFNSARFLSEAIASVRSQTFEDWEIIFWDNQSTDESKQIATSVNDPRIHYFCAPVHTPLGEARHLAIQQANGNWIGLLDCDDVWLPNKLQTQLDIAAQNSRLGLIYSDMLLCNVDGEVIGKGSDRFIMRRGRVWEALLYSRNFIPCPAALMKRTAVWNAGGFDCSLRYCEEFDLFLKIARNYDVDYAASPLVKYRIHDGNITGFGNQQTTAEYIQVLRREIAMSRTNETLPKLKTPAFLRSNLRLGLLQLRLYQQQALAAVSA